MSSYILETIFRWDVAREAPYIHIIRPQFLAPNAKVDAISKHKELYSKAARKSIKQSIIQEILIDFPLSILFPVEVNS